VTLYGLKVKVLSRDMDEFPGGYHFHQRSKEFMKDLFAGNVKPFIFHMSWTSNKVNGGMVRSREMHATKNGRNCEKRRRFFGIWLLLQ
jgi:hypothetical protein